MKNLLDRTEIVEYTCGGGELPPPYRTHEEVVRHMARRKISADEMAQFSRTVLPLIAKNATWEEIAHATGMSIAGARYRVTTLLRQQKSKQRFEPIGA